MSEKSIVLVGIILFAIFGLYGIFRDISPKKSKVTGLTDGEKYEQDLLASWLGPINENMKYEMKRYLDETKRLSNENPGAWSYFAINFYFADQIFKLRARIEELEKK